jgi:hypothetical protein
VIFTKLALFCGGVLTSSIFVWLTWMFARQMFLQRRRGLPLRYASKFGTCAVWSAGGAGVQMLATGMVWSHPFLALMLGVPIPLAGLYYVSRNKFRR